MSDERQPLTDDALRTLEPVCVSDGKLLARIIPELLQLRAEKAALVNCEHRTHAPTGSVDWCATCGAVAVEGQWQKPVYWPDR